MTVASPTTPATQPPPTTTTATHRSTTAVSAAPTTAIAAKFAASTAPSATTTSTLSTDPTKPTVPTIPTHQLPTLLATKPIHHTHHEEVPANATCVEFLHLMKAFSESAVNVTEMAQRVDSLVHQDEQLLRLLPLQPTPRHTTSNTTSRCENDTIGDDALAHAGGRVSTSSSSSRGSSAGSVTDTTDDETSSASGRGTNEYGVDIDAMVAAMDVSMAEGMKKWHAEAMKQGRDDDSDGVDLDLDLDLDMEMEMDVDLDDDDDSDEGFVSDDMGVEEDESMDDDDGASTDADDARSSSSKPRISSLGDVDDDEHDAHDDAALHERRAQEDLQRWMELELDLDSTEDPYDVSLHLPGVHVAAPVSSTVSGAPTSVANAALGVHATSLTTTAGSHANSSSVLSTTTALATKDRFRAALFDRKSVTAALFDDDDDDATDLVLMNALMKKKQSTTTTTTTTTTIHKPSLGKRPLDLESTSDDDTHGNLAIWGMEVDSYEQDLLSSIDHSVLCDRENRFLQWDLEIEAATAAAVAAAAVSQHKMTAELRTPPALSSFASSVSHSGSVFASASAEARQKLLMASSPREHKMHPPVALRSPSNVDTTTFAAEDWSSLDFGTFQNRTVSHILSSCLHKRKLHHPYKDRVTLVNFNVPGGEPIGPLPNHAATGSLLFGGGLEAADVLVKSGAVGHGLLSTTADAKELKQMKTGEKKAKKARVDGERKKSASQKQLEGYDFGAGTDSSGHAGFSAKLAMTKLENLPLPDLTNLPQDLKELKRKIEATEHKVEGTKHRHRKGGPCPRCQVQNQLRAAKRAYHKRAVAHKKLPQLGTVSPALTATAVVVTPPPSTPAVVTSVPSPPVTIIAKPAVAAASIAQPSSSNPEAPKPPTLKTIATAPSLTPVSTVAAVVTAPATLVRQASAPIAQQPQPTPVPSAALLKPATPMVTTPPVAVQATKPIAVIPAVAAAPVSAPTPFPRRSCGETALSSPFASPATVPSDGSAPSSPESASPPVHHVTVTSA